MTPNPEILAAWKRLDAAQKASAKLADSRADLPAGSSRAKVTTANAKWARAAAERDHALLAYKDALYNECERMGVRR